MNRLKRQTKKATPQKNRTSAKRIQQIERTRTNPPVSNPKSLPPAIQEALPPSISEPDEDYEEDLEEDLEEAEEDMDYE